MAEHSGTLKKKKSVYPLWMCRNEQRRSFKTTLVSRQATSDRDEAQISLSAAQLPREAEGLFCLCVLNMCETRQLPDSPPHSPPPCVGTTVSNQWGTVHRSENNLRSHAVKKRPLRKNLSAADCEKKKKRLFKKKTKLHKSRWLMTFR